VTERLVAAAGSGQLLVLMLLSGFIIDRVVCGASTFSRAPCRRGKLRPGSRVPMDTNDEVGRLSHGFNRNAGAAFHRNREIHAFTSGSRARLRWPRRILSRKNMPWSNSTACSTSSP